MMSTDTARSAARKQSMREDYEYFGTRPGTAGRLDMDPNHGDGRSAERLVSRRMWMSSIVSALPSFLFGYCISALNTALVTGDTGGPEGCFSGSDPTCPRGSALRDIDLSTGKQEMATSLLIAGCWVGSMLASRPSDSIGRRSTLLVNNVPFIGGGVVCAIAVTARGLYFGRVLGGMAVGCGSGVVPVLLSEVSSTKSRGAVGSVHQLMINLGILSSGLLGYALVEDVEHGWRYIQGFIAVPAVAQLALAAFVPESPRWLVKQGRVTEAKAVMRKLQAVPRAGYEEDIDREIEAMDGGKGEDRKGNPSWAEVFVNRRPIFIGVMLMFMQAFTGINTVIFYSTTIFELAGVGQTVLATVSVGLTLVAMTLVAGRLVDRAGRRQLILVGTIVMAGALGVMSVSLFTLNSVTRLQGYLAVAATLTFIAGFSVGQGSTGWILLAEIVPSRIRAQAFSIFTAVNWASNLFIGLYTLSAIDAMGAWLLPTGSGGDDSPSPRDQQKAGVAGLYALFAMLCIVTIFSVYFFVPETMGKSLEELEGGGGGAVDRTLVSYALSGAEDDHDVGDALLRSEHGGSVVTDSEDACRVAL